MEPLLKSKREIRNLQFGISKYPPSHRQPRTNTATHTKSLTSQLTEPKLLTQGRPHQICPQRQSTRSSGRNWYIRTVEYTRFLRYAFMVMMCFFWTCLCPHSHSKPIILSLRTISSQLSALHFVFCLWNFQRVSASSRVNGTERFADNKNHAVTKPRLNHIAGINTPELSRASKICAISLTLLCIPSG